MGLDGAVAGIDGDRPTSRGLPPAAVLGRRALWMCMMGADMDEIGKGGARAFIMRHGAVCSAGAGAKNGFFRALPGACWKFYGGRLEDGASVCEMSRRGSAVFRRRKAKRPVVAVG